MKRLILNADDFGSNPHANAAIMQLLDGGYISSSTVMAPAAHFDEVAAWCKSNHIRNVGLHLTFTNEFRRWPFGGVTTGRSLVDADGCMWRSETEVEANADTAEVVAEIDAQFRKALDAGIDLSHADNHMGSLYGLGTPNDWLVHTFDACAKYGMAGFRLFKRFDMRDAFNASVYSHAFERRVNELIAYGEGLGLRFPDYLLFDPYAPSEGDAYEPFRDMLIQKLHDLPEGTSEIFIHPETPNPDCPERIKRVWEYRVAQDPLFIAAFKDAGVELITYRDI